MSMCGVLTRPSNGEPAASGRTGRPTNGCPDDAVTVGCVPISDTTTKVKKVLYNLTENDDFDREEIATYEEVARLFPRAGYFRPIVLIGPPGVGRNELKRRIIALESDRFKATVPRKNCFLVHTCFSRIL